MQDDNSITTGMPDNPEESGLNPTGERDYIPIDTPIQSKEAECDSSCDCHSQPGGGNNVVRWVIIVLIVISAGFFIGKGIMKKPANASAPQGGISAGGEFQPYVRTDSAAIRWSNQLPSFMALNELAADKDAVFLYLVAPGSEPLDSVKYAIEKATHTVQSGGINITYFLLSNSSPEFTQIAADVPLPCVLAMVKGGGMLPVTGDLSEGRLLSAIVTASRPSGGCGPDVDCGPDGLSCP